MKTENLSGLVCDSIAGRDTAGLVPSTQLLEIG